MAWTRERLVAWAMIAACALLAGCADPIAQYVNKKWPPVDVTQQRQAAISSTAKALGTLTTPNIAFAVNFADAQKLVYSQDLKDLGVTRLTLSGDRQLVRLDVEFSHRFTAADARQNADLAKILAEHTPEVVGSVTVFMGVVAGLVTEKLMSRLEVHLLPSVGEVRVKRIKLQGGVDVTVVGEALTGLLNQYKDNISGELSRQAFASFSIPALSQTSLDLRQSFHLAGPSGTASIEVQADPITVPFKLTGLAMMVTDDQLSGLVQLSPLASMPGPLAPLEATFDAIRKRMRDLTAHAFEVPDADTTNWIAVRRDLVAAAMNSVTAQANACVTAAVDVPTQHTSNTVKLPNGAGIDCTPNLACNVRTCSFELSHDEQNCHGCLVASPRVCVPTPWGQKCIGGGGCVTEGNLPWCEAAKAAQNAIYLADANQRKAACDAGAVADRAVCETEKTGIKALCEAGKGALNAIAHTGNFANIDTDTHLRTGGMKICLRDFNMSTDLDKVQFALDVTGQAQADINVKFTPLDIMGHLTCQFPWSKAQTFDASLRQSRLGIASDLRLVMDGDKAKVNFATVELPIQAHLSPSPMEYLVNSPAMILSCPIMRGIAPLVVVMTPFIKELRGDIDTTLPSYKGSLDLALPSQTVGGYTLRGVARPTELALVVVGTVVATAGRAGGANVVSGTEAGV